MEPKEKNEYRTSVLLDLAGIGIFAVILIYDLLKGKEFIGTAVISLYWIIRTFIDFWRMKKENGK